MSDMSSPNAYNGGGTVALQSHTPPTGPTDETRGNLWNRFKKLQSVDILKNSLIEELLVRYDTLSQQHKTECADLDREKEFNRNAQNQLKSLRDQLTRQAQLMIRDPYAVVLLDGDGMIFHDQLLQEGEMGGRRAAGLLYSAVVEYAQRILPEFPTLKVITRLYANFKGLSETLYRTGVVETPSVIEDFFRGFTRGKALFDCIDVGSGKDRADDKLGEYFKHYLYNFQCQHVILGCSHDNGYVRLLDEILMETETIKRITLLQGVPFEREYSNLPFPKTKFNNLFRESKLNVYGHLTQIGATPQSHDAFNKLPIAPFPPPGIIARRDTGSPAPPGRTSSCSSADIAPTNPSASWAAAVGKHSNAPVDHHQAPVPAMMTTIPRNRQGQRVDINSCAYEKEEVQRVKAIKMCNVHFLRHDCPFGKECTHDHTYKPTTAELQVLRLVARMAPCARRSGCDDVKCIYGHMCPAPESKDPKVRASSKNCIFGENCRFAPELHGLDKIVVKMTKVT